MCEMSFRPRLVFNSVRLYAQGCVVSGLLFDSMVLNNACRLGHLVGDFRAKVFALPARRRCVAKPRFSLKLPAIVCVQG
jgi:hypothetical protein